MKILIDFFTLKVGLSFGSSFQHFLINSTINWGPKFLGNGILFSLDNASMTSGLENPPQGFPPFEKISKRTTPNENTSHLEEILSFKRTSGALHYWKGMND